MRMHIYVLLITSVVIVVIVSSKPTSYYSPPRVYTRLPHGFLRVASVVLRNNYCRPFHSGFLAWRPCCHSACCWGHSLWDVVNSSAGYGCLSLWLSLMLLRRGEGSPVIPSMVEIPFCLSARLGWMLGAYKNMPPRETCIRYLRLYLL